MIDEPETGNPDKPAAGFFLLRTVLDSDPSGIAVVAGPETRFMLVNRAYRELTPQPDVDPLGRLYEQVWPEADGYGSGLQVIRKVIEGGSPIQRERNDIHYPDGRIRTCAVHIRPIDWKGQPAALIILWDLTSQERERQQVEIDREKFRASDEHFRQLADAMPQLVWTARPDGMVDYYNRRYIEYAGIHFAPGEERWEWKPVVHPADLSATSDAWEHSVKTGQIYQIEHRIQMADGSYRWHLSRGVPALDENKQVIRWYGTATDIHALKEAEGALRERSQGLALLSDTAAQLLVDSNPHALLTKLFSRISELLSLDVYLQYRLPPGADYLELVSSAGLNAQISSTLQRLSLENSVSGKVAITREPIVIEDIQNSRDEQASLVREIGLSFYVCNPMVAKGRLVGTLAFGSRMLRRIQPDALEFLRTVSHLVAAAIDRSQAETELKTYADSLERSNNELQNFAFIASHDLQEPLRKIEAFGDSLLKHREGLNEEQLDYLNRIKNASARMRAMVDDLLQLSRLTTEAQPFQLVDLNEVMAEVLSDLEINIQRTKGTVIVGKLMSVEADPLQMYQLLQNLVGNALKFHKPGEKPVVTVTAEEAVPGWVQLHVQDHGIGFDEQHLDRIFLPFHRLVGRSEYEGSGIGLALCKKIIDRHGGRIHARSTPGKGTSFIVQLRIQQSGIFSHQAPGS